MRRAYPNQTGLACHRLRCWPSAAAIVVAGLLAACADTLPVSPSPSHFGLLYNDDRFCPLGGGDDITFIVDPNAPEPVVATTLRGRVFHVRWPIGFVGGTEQDPVVLDAAGNIVVRDGDRIAMPKTGFPNVGGYSVCVGDDTLWVLPESVRRV